MVVVKEVCGLGEVSGLDGHDGDVELGELLSEDGAGALHGVLGGAVDGEAGVAVEACNAAHIDDAA